MSSLLLSNSSVGSHLLVPKYSKLAYYYYYYFYRGFSEKIQKKI